MLDLTPINLIREVNNAYEYAQLFMDAYERNRRVMCGPGYRKDKRSDASVYNPINVVHEWMARVRPRITFNDPTWVIKSRRAGAMQLVATGIEHALNAWVKRTMMHRTNRKFCGDFGLAMAVARVHPRDMDSDLWAEFDDPVTMPVVERISPRRFFWDPMALSQEECRFFGHFWVKDRNDLIREAKEDPDTWNLAAVQNLSGGGGREYVRDEDDEYEVDRDEIVGCSIWIPEARPDDELGSDDGFNGGIVDIAMQASHDGGEESEADGVVIRPLRPFYGPRWGPYAWWGADVVPDETMPLAPLTAAQTQMEDLNRIARREVMNAAGYRRLLFVNDAKEELSDIVKDEPDRSVIPTAGVKKEDITEVEILGNTQQGMAQLMWTRQVVDDVLGMDDAQRGTVTGKGSATEVAEAAQNSNARVDDLTFAFASGLNIIGKTMAWYFFHDDRVAMPLDDETAQRVGMEAPWFFGGDDRKPEVRRRIAKRLLKLGIVPPEEWVLYGGNTDHKSGATFDDLDLQIDIKSMSRVDPRIRAQEVLGALSTFDRAVQLGAAAPWGDWKGYLQIAGDIYNVPELADLWDEALYAQMVSQGMSAQQGPRQFSMLASMAGAAGGAGKPSQQAGGSAQFGGGRGGAPARPGGGGGQQSQGAQAMRMQPGATPAPRK